MTTRTSTSNENANNPVKELEEMDITNRKYRWNAALAYHKVSPTFSRVLMSQILKSTDLTKTLKPRVQRGICQFCGSVFLPSNHTWRIAPKSKISKRIKKLIRMQKNTSWKMNGIHKKYLESLHTRASKMIYKCLKCFKCTKIPLENPHKHLLLNKTCHNAIPQITNPPVPISKKIAAGVLVQPTEEKKLSDKQHLLNSTLKSSSKKKKQKKRKNKGSFCQLKSLLKNHSSEISTKTRLESFLSSV